MNHKNKIKEVCKKAWNTFPKQITIDIIQDAEQLLYSEEDEADMRDSIGSLNYRVSIVLEVLNPELKYDKQLLTDLDSALNEWTESIEFVNKSLGIPPEGNRN